MSAQKTVRSSCLCGRVRIAADLPSERIGHCHCDNCRRAHGAGVWTWATFRTEAVRVESGESELRPYVSDTRAVRRFCATCGSTLTYESPRWPEVIDLSLANFEEPLSQAPTYHTYADRSPDWCPILDDLPQRGGPDGMQPI